MLLSGDSQNKLEKLLIEQQLISSAQLNQLKEESARTNKSIISLINEKKLVGEEQLTHIVATANHVPYVNLTNFRIEPEVQKSIPKDLAQSYQAVPIGELKGRLAVGMIDPTNIQAIDFLTRKIGKAITPYLISSASINHILSQYKADVAKEVSDVVNTVNELIPQGHEAEKAKAVENNEQLQNIVQDAPITRALRSIMEHAYRIGASDVHIEPTKDEVVVRMRIDGVLQEVMKLPKQVEAALVSRVKILTNLKIDEHRIPQDGEFPLEIDGMAIDNRVSVSPVIWGEQIVIRLLVKNQELLTLDKLGFKGRSLRVIEEGIKKPHGMTLSTGPTGSGKSTTLYTVINEIKNVTINIVTLEDPVEYKMSGINQMQMNSEIGLTFASGLRSVLRQDPDVVMVGEIRDAETADLAVQAALTGHLVLSTLHTNSATGVLPRLLDMKVEPFLIASTVNTVIGQRLVRLLCTKCRKEDKTTETESKAVQQALANILPETHDNLAALQADYGYENLPKINESAYTIYRAQGCKECTDGYKGRTGIYEVFAMTPAIEKLLAGEATSNDIQKQAVADGMVTMRQDGFLKVLNGVTTLEEVARVSADH